MAATAISRHAVERWLERIDPEASELETKLAIRQFLADARVLDKTPRNCFLVHPDWPRAILVAVYNGDHCDQVITVNLRYYEVA